MLAGAQMEVDRVSNTIGIHAMEEAARTHSDIGVCVCAAVPFILLCKLSR